MMFIVFAALPGIVIWTTLRYSRWRRLTRQAKPIEALQLAMLAATLQFLLAIPYWYGVVALVKLLNSMVVGRAFDFALTGGEFDLVFMMTTMSWIAAFPVGLAVLYIGWQLNRRWREYHHHLCECGYDLTGNVSGVCPECGTPIKG